jgi:hypothetical protein
MVVLNRVIGQLLKLTVQDFLGVEGHLSAHLGRGAPLYGYLPVEAALSDLS